jgi:hypothetical protein
MLLRRPLAKLAASSSCSSPTGLAATRSPLLSLFRRRRSCGIVGLPNIGKSTLFNALTQTQIAEATNYPFCTIEPNTASVGVGDALLDTLAKAEGSAKVIRSKVRSITRSVVSIVKVSWPRRLKKTPFLSVIMFGCVFL